MKLNPMTRHDLSQVLHIETQNQALPWAIAIFENYLQNPACLCYSLIQNQMLIGFAILQIAVDEAELITISIDPYHQKQGYGEFLLEQLIEICRDKNLERLFLEVRISNHRAIRLYEKKGFKTYARRKNYYPTHDGREDAILMTLKLGDR